MIARVRRSGRGRQRITSSVALVVSVGAHLGLVFGWRGAAAAPVPARPDRLVEFELPPPPPPPPPPAPSPPPPRTEPSVTTPAPRVAPRLAAPPKSAPSTPVPAAPTPLTSEHGAEGDRVAEAPPAPAPPAPAALPAAPPPAPPPPPRPAAPPPPRVVALRDLAEKPRPPALGDSIERHYPRDARERGLAGSATVRVSLGADGVARRVDVMTETGGGFGAACREAVLGSRWSAPRDNEGRAVPTELAYRCRFEVQR